MTIQRPLKTVLAALVGALFLHTGAAIAADAPAVEGQSVRPARAPETKEQIERRLASVSTLLESSSAMELRFCEHRFELRDALLGTLFLRS